MSSLCRFNRREFLGATAAAAGAGAGGLVQISGDPQRTPSKAQLTSGVRLKVHSHLTISCPECTRMSTSSLLRPRRPTIMI
jgi:hypothetical protein